MFRRMSARAHVSATDTERQCMVDAWTFFKKFVERKTKNRFKYSIIIIIILKIKQVPFYAIILPTQYIESLSLWYLVSTHCLLSITIMPTRRACVILSIFPSPSEKLLYKQLQCTCTVNEWTLTVLYYGCK